jgi:hypothetical protein
VSACGGGGDALILLVFVKDNSINAMQNTVLLEFQKFKGTYDSVAMQLAAKVKKNSGKLTGVSICPRDTNVNDEKVTLVLSYLPVKTHSDRKFDQLTDHVIFNDSV